MIKRKQLYLYIIIILLILQGALLILFSDEDLAGPLVFLFGFLVIVGIIQIISDRKHLDEEIVIFRRKFNEEILSGYRCKRCKHELTDNLYCENCGFPTDMAFNNLANLFKKYEYAFNEREENLHGYFEYIECKLYMPEKVRKKFSWAAAQLEESLQFLSNHFNNSNYTDYSYVFNRFKEDMYINPLKEEVLYSEHFQLDMRNKIEDESKRVNKELKEMHNSSILQSEKYFEFEELLKDYEILFNKDTIEFKNNLLRKLIKTHHIKVDNNAINFADSKLDIDNMDGHEFEHFCANLLKNNGFINVDVTPGSGDQGVDVLAEKDGISFAIQCKCYSGNLGNSPVQEVVSGKTFYHCQIGVVMTNSYFTDGAKKLAEETGTLLWDRDKLASMIELSKSKK